MKRAFTVFVWVTVAVLATVLVTANINAPTIVTSVAPSATNKVVSVPNNGNQPKLVNKPLWRVTAGVNDTLFLFGEIGEENSETVSQGILALSDSGSNAPILLVIDSPGGTVFAGSKVISAIEASKRPVYTICYGMCASMAAMIHQYGTKRLMTNRSILMFHNASGGAQGELNQMLSQLQFVERFCLKMDQRIAQRAGISWQQFTNLLNNQIWIDAEDATSVGFNDRIVSLNLSNVRKTILLPFMNRTKHAIERIEVK